MEEGMENSRNPKLSLCVNSHEADLCHWGPAIQVLLLWKLDLGYEFLEDFILPKQFNITPQLEGERSETNFNNPAPFQLCFVHC